MKVSGIRAVIDSNALRTSQLDDWLAASHANYAVLTDYLWMEIYKGSERTGLLESLKVIRKYPDQVLPLKGTKEISALDARSPGYANAMIMPFSKAKFRDTVYDLDAVELFHPPTMASIKQHGEVARRHFAKMSEVASILPQFLNNADTVFGPEMVSEFRKRQRLSRSSVRRFIDITDNMFMAFVDRHPYRPRRFSGVKRINSFMWRYALASVVITKRYLANGSSLPSNASKVVNDLTDGIFAVYGTFFNGVMTSDKRLETLYFELEAIVRGLGGRMPAHYLEAVTSSGST